MVGDLWEEPESVGNFGRLKLSQLPDKESWCVRWSSGLILTIQSG